jgi:spore germination cell wall hydrolase CwlJ-like protein
MILETALMCMAANIYHEAKNQPMAGQIAVAQVVMNRVKDNRYPDNVCDVVKQGLTYKNGKVVLGKCQFSWYCDGKKDDVDKKSEKWRNCLRYASMVITNRITLDVTEGATHYHATYVRPAWARTKTKTVRINRHIFYRWEKK